MLLSVEGQMHFVSTSHPENEFISEIKQSISGQIQQEGWPSQGGARRKLMLCLLERRGAKM